MDERLYRSSRDRVLAGVAGGLAERYGADVSVIRIGWVLLAIASGGVLALVYLLMAIVVPEASAGVPGPGAPSGAGPGATSGSWTPGGWSASPGPTERTAGGGRNTSVVIGIGLILLGAWFLLDRYLSIRIDWDLVWPLVVIALGAVLVAGALRRGGRSGPG